ncbi:hypothetical protein ABT154_21550 [Streptomyces sp. NPDC001728]|uniref:hypothetical protein n=1 Tax=Streptomyces sp. NPDC001728 TaxID=3154396 RepID=UPI00332D2A10
MTTVTPLDSLVDKPSMAGMYYGIGVSDFGEDGGMIALGHHTPRRALAVFNAHARRHWGMRNLADDRNAHAQPWLDVIVTRWALFRRPDPSQGEHPDWLWYAESTVPGTPDAQPVTILTA